MEETITQTETEVIWNVENHVKQGYFTPALLLLQEKGYNYLDLLEENTKNTLLHLAILQSKITESVMLIKQYKDFIDVPNLIGQTPLMFATYMGNIPLIKLLIKYGADLNRQDKNGFSPLLYATKANLEFTCLYLIEKGAIITVCDTNKCSIVHWAAYKDNVNLLIFYVKHLNLDICQLDWQLNSPLMRAAKNNSYQSVKFLLNYMKDNLNLSLQILPKNINLQEVKSEYIVDAINNHINQRESLIKKRCKSLTYFKIRSFPLSLRLLFVFFLYFLTQINLYVQTALYDNSFDQLQFIFSTFSLILILYFLLYRNSHNTEQNENNDIHDCGEILPLTTNTEQEIQSSLPITSRLKSLLPAKTDNFIFRVIDLIEDNKIFELDQVAQQKLNYHTLTIQQDRENYWYHFNEYLKSKETQQHYDLFCFYSYFYQKVIKLGKEHRIYLFIQYMIFISIILQIRTIINSFNNGLVLAIWFQPFEILIKSLKEDEYLPLMALHYVILLVILYILTIQLIISIYGISANLTYYELMNEDKCPYLFSSLVEVKRYFYKRFKNPYDKGFFKNLRFYFCKT